MLKHSDSSENGLIRRVNKEYRRILRKIWWADHTVPVSAKKREMEFRALGRRWEYLEGLSPKEYDNGIYLALARIVHQNAELARRRRRKLVYTGIAGILIAGGYWYQNRPTEEPPAVSCSVGHADPRPTARQESDFRMNYARTLYRTESRDSLKLLEFMLDQNYIRFSPSEIKEYREIIEQKYYKMSVK